jgi:hypothetical protein
MQEALSITPGAVGLFDLGVIVLQRLPVKPAGIDDIAASEASVQSGRYPFAKDLAFVSVEEPGGARRRAPAPRRRRRQAAADAQQRLHPAPGGPVSAPPRTPVRKDSLALRRYLDARMLPLAVLLAVLVSLSAPLAYFTLTAGTLRTRAHATAAQVAAAIGREIQARPVLWRYDDSNLLAQIQAHTEQPGIARIEVVDRTGVRVPLDPPARRPSSPTPCCGSPPRSRSTSRSSATCGPAPRSPTPAPAPCCC